MSEESRRRLKDITAWILRRQDMVAWIGFIWHRTLISGKLL